MKVNVEDVEVISCHVSAFQKEIYEVVKRRSKQSYKTKIINTICCGKELDEILCTIIFEKEES